MKSTIHLKIPAFLILHNTILGLGCSLEYFAETAEMAEAIDNLKETSQSDKDREILYQKVSTILGYYQVKFG